MNDGKVEAVFFDLDGTLADTAPDLGGALNRLLEEQGREAVDMATLRPYVSSGARGMVGIGFGMTPQDEAYADLVRRFLDIYASMLSDGTRLFDGMASLLDQLESRHIRWGVVTNKSTRFTLPLMETLNLSHRAAAIISGDSAPRPKPAPDPLLLACANAGVRPDRTLFVGDDLRDIQAAHAAGMPGIAAAWGYLGDGPGIQEWGANAIIDDPLDLLGLL